MLFVVSGDLSFSFDNPLDSYSEIMFGRPENVGIVLEIGWNIKYSCAPSLIN